MSPQEYLDGEEAGFQRRAWGKGTPALPKTRGPFVHFYLFPWSPESRTLAYCLALIQRREDIKQPMGWISVG